LAKKVHGTRAVKAKIGYGILSEGIFASFPKNKLKTTMVKNGWMIAQAAPNAVCLYRILYPAIPGNTAVDGIPRVLLD